MTNRNVLIFFMSMFMSAILFGGVGLAETPSISGGISGEWQDDGTDETSAVGVRLSVRGSGIHVDMDLDTETSDVVLKRTFVSYSISPNVELRAGNVRMPKGMASWTGYQDTIHSTLDGFGRSHELGVSALMDVGPAHFVVSMDKDTNAYARAAISHGTTKNGLLHVGAHAWDSDDMDYGAEIAGVYNRFAANAEFLPNSENWYSAVRFSILGHSYHYDQSIISLPHAGGLEASYRYATKSDGEIAHSLMAGYNVTDALSVGVNYDWDATEVATWTASVLHTF